MFVANTNEHISIRVSSELIQALRAEALLEDRSLSYVINRHLLVSTGVVLNPVSAEFMEKREAENILEQAAQRELESSK